MFRHFVLLQIFAFGAIAFTPDQLRLSAEARGVLAHHCTKCHGQGKQKGGLRLDLKDLALKGGDDGAVLVAGHPAESVLIQRITLSKDHDDVMPPEGGKIEKQEIETLRKWVSEGAPWPEGETAGITFQRAPIAPRKPEFPERSEAFENPIDKFIGAYFGAQKFPTPPPVDDRTYLRRVTLDSIGLLPTPAELAAFKGDRAAAVDALLARKDDYASHWMSFWNDALRNDYSGTGYIDGGRKQISRWLYAALREDKPYDQFVRELLVPNAESEGFLAGIKWRGNVSASQRTEVQAAQNIAQVFLGLNLKCASCHDSFISDYKLTDAYALAAVFSDKPLDVFRCDKPTGEKTTAAFFWPELGEIDAAKPRAERQKQLAALLTRKEDGRLARTLVNRLWAVCFGRGLVEPVEVMDNRPWNQDLLDWLAWDLAENGWRVQRTLRLILTSHAYQLPSVAVPDADALAKSSFVFRGPVVRRLSAEQFSDAVSNVATPLYKKRDFVPGPKEDPLTKGASWIWHTEPKPVGIDLPEGKRFFRNTAMLPPGKVRLARVVATADNILKLYVNGSEVLRSKEWENAESADVTPIVAGGNSVTIAAVAENTEPGAAGLRAAMAVWFEGQNAPFVVDTNPNWRTSTESPEGWQNADFDDCIWTSATVLGPAGLPWDSLGGVRNFVLTEPSAFTRASLVSNDDFQTILGRPIRDQVTMSRPTQTTLLQALNFANGRSFTTALDRAAKKWTERFPDPDKRLDAIYETALLRAPREDERAFASAAPADLLWSIVLLPEFQLIR
jgi:mono/diheme cytochrome c family protein